MDIWCDINYKFLAKCTKNKWRLSHIQNILIRILTSIFKWQFCKSFCKSLALKSVFLPLTWKCTQFLDNGRENQFKRYANNITVHHWLLKYSSWSIKVTKTYQKPLRILCRFIFIVYFHSVLTDIKINQGKRLILLQWECKKANC